MSAINKFAGHLKRAHLIILISTGRAEAGLTAKRNEFQFTTIRACIESATIRRVTAMNHLIDVINFCLAGMKLVEHLLIIIK